MIVKVSQAREAPATDTSNCPVCQQANLCQVEKGKDCWCVKEQIPKALIKTLPKEKQGKSCLCQACVQRFKMAQELSVDIATDSIVDE